MGAEVVTRLMYGDLPDDGRHYGIIRGDGQASPPPKTVETLKLEGKRYVVDSVSAGGQNLTFTRFARRQIPLHEAFGFRIRL
jgi:hypothetical protein